MKSIKLLDCTLRDGGYINDWKFGQDHIESTMRLLEESGSDIIEIGFIRDEPLDKDRTVYKSIEAITDFIPSKKPGVLYTAMAEVVKPISMDLISERSEKTVDAIRIIVWKDKHDENGNIVDALQDGYEYCKGFVEKGYEIFVQPARVEQYSDEEFIKMLELFAPLNPRAIYIVDSWGTMYSKDVLHYLKLADEVLDKKISIGFHGHNNMMQAFSNAVDFINTDIDRELILDASVYGMGRGAGNLNSEIIAKYLNENEGKNYNITSFFEIFEKTVKELDRKYKWGYSPAYYMSGHYHANPQYGTYYGVDNDVSSVIIDRIFRNMSDEDKVLYSSKKAQDYLDKYSEK